MPTKKAKQMLDRMTWEKADHEALQETFRHSPGTALRRFWTDVRIALFQMRAKPKPGTHKTPFIGRVKK